MTLSKAQLDSINKQNKEAKVFVLISIGLENGDGANNIFLNIVNNNEDIISNGVLYHKYFFYPRINLGEGSSELIIPNYSDTVLSSIKGINQGSIGDNTLFIDYFVVNSLNYDLHIVEKIRIYCDGVKYDLESIALRLAGATLKDVKHPFTNFDAKRYNGVH